MRRGMVNEFTNRIDMMHKLFGEIPDRKCKDCPHLCSYRASHKWYKCECYGETASAASDWRLKWAACGLIDKEYDGYPIIRRVRALNAKKKTPTQIEGQVSLFD